MSRCSITWVVLCSAITTFAISARAETQDTAFIQVPVVTEGRMQFFHMSWPSTRAVTRKIIQDNQGFLWLGAGDGLRRYDGYTLMRVSEDVDGNSLGFINAESLMKDHSGAFWFGIDGFLARYDPASGQVRRYRTTGGPRCRDAGCDAHQIIEDRNGFMWLSTTEGLVRLDPVRGSRTYYQHRPEDDSTIASDIVISTIEARDGLLWVASSAALDAFDRHAGKVIRRIRFGAESGGHLSLYGFPANLYEDRSGTLWAGLSSGGDLASIDPKTGKVTVYSFRIPGSKKSAPSFVVSIAEDDAGALWLGTTGLGLLKFEHGFGRVISYESDPEDPNSLSGDLAVGLFRDREGIFWAHTKGGDVVRFDSRPPVFRSYVHDPRNTNSLIDSAVISAYEDSQGILWIGTERGLNRIDRQTGKVKRYENSEFAPGVRSITEDRNGSLWFGTRGNGLIRFDRRTGAMQTFRYRRNDPSSLSNDYVAALLVDRDGVLWAATDSGVNRYDEKTGQFQNFKPDDNRPTRYHSIAEDRNGALWLASSEFGLHRFQPATAAFTEFHSTPGDSGALSHDHVYTVYADKSGTIWAATFGGLDKFNPAGETFTHYDARNGLPTNTALGVLDDEDGYLWISTPDGLARFNPRTAIAVSYHIADGLPSDFFNTLAVASKSREGEMFFGSFAGLVAFLPKHVVEHKSVPPVVFTNFRLFGEPVTPGKGPLKQPIWSASGLDLAAGSIFSLDFSALSYIDPARTRYRYRLEGLETKWNGADSSRRTASYSTLPPGDYIMRVQARTNRADWTESGARLEIRIPPPWYATLWFRSLGALTFFVMVWAVYRVRLHQLAQELNAHLEGRVEERLRVAREFHDTLLQSFQGLIPLFQTARNLLPAQPGRAAEILDDGLAEAANAIVEGRNAIQNLRANQWMDRDLESLLNAAGRDLSRAAQAGETAPAFRVIVEGARQPLTPLFQDEVYRIGLEMLRNAFRHAHASRIEVEIRYEGGAFRLRIRDDGKGIDSRILKEGASRGHWGLAGMNERANKLGGRLRIWSESGAGTEAELTVPARVAYTKRPRAIGDRLSWAGDWRTAAKGKRDVGSK